MDFLSFLFWTSGTVGHWRARTVPARHQSSTNHCRELVRPWVGLKKLSHKRNQLKLVKILSVETCCIFLSSKTCPLFVWVDDCDVRWTVSAYVDVPLETAQLGALEDLRRDSFDVTSGNSGKTGELAWQKNNQFMERQHNLKDLRKSTKDEEKLLFLDDLIKPKEFMVLWQFSWCFVCFFGCVFPPAIEMETRQRGRGDGYVLAQDLQVGFLHVSPRDPIEKEGGVEPAWAMHGYKNKCFLVQDQLEDHPTRLDTSLRNINSCMESKPSTWRSTRSPCVSPRKASKRADTHVRSDGFMILL